MNGPNPLNEVLLDEELDDLLSFYEVVTHHGNRERLKRALIDLTRKHVRAASEPAGGTR